MSEYIEVGQPLQFTDPNTPTRVGEIVENVGDIYNIPSPRVGMRVFVKSEKKSYVISSLKSKVVNGLSVPNAQVEAFRCVEDELIDRIQGVSNNSNSAKDPFKFLGTFTRVTGGEFLNALNAMHSTVAGVYDGFWRALIGASPVEIYNFAIYYKDDRWIQVLKSPYKWGDGDFDIISDTRYRTIYRIHENGAWGEWKDTEKELEKSISAETKRAEQAERNLDDKITAETQRAKVAEQANRQLIADLVGKSPETLDTIHEISSWILNDKTGAAAMAKEINENRNNINLNNIAIENEIFRAIGAEETLQKNIDNTNKIVGIEEKKKLSVYKGAVLEDGSTYSTPYSVYTEGFKGGDIAITNNGYYISDARKVSADGVAEKVVFNSKRLRTEKGYTYQLNISKDNNAQFSKNELEDIVGLYNYEGGAIKDLEQKVNNSFSSILTSFNNNSVDLDFGNDNNPFLQTISILNANESRAGVMSAHDYNCLHSLNSTKELSIEFTDSDEKIHLSNTKHPFIPKGVRIKIVSDTITTLRGYTENYTKEFTIKDGYVTEDNIAILQNFEAIGKVTIKYTGAIKELKEELTARIQGKSGSNRPLDDIVYLGNFSSYHDLIRKLVTLHSDDAGEAWDYCGLFTAIINWSSRVFIMNSCTSFEDGVWQQCIIGNVQVVETQDELGFYSHGMNIVHRYRKNGSWSEWRNINDGIKTMTITPDENTIKLETKTEHGNVDYYYIPSATTKKAGVMSAEDKKALDAVNSIINIGEYQNIQAVWDACKQVALNNPEISIIKYSVKAGVTYNSGVVFQSYHYNDSIITQYYLYGGGQKHECNIRHIVSDGTTDDWQPIQMFTSYKFENGTLYGYKYGKSESEQNKVAIVNIPNIGAGEYFVPTSGEYNIDGNTYRAIRFGSIPPPGVIVNINTTSYEIITLYVPSAPYSLTVNVNGDEINDLPSTRAGVYYIFTGSKKVIALDTL